MITTTGEFQTNNLKEYFTKDERNCVGYIIRRYHNHFIGSSNEDDIWSVGYYAIYRARTTYRDDMNCKYFTWLSKIVYEDLYKFKNWFYQQKRVGDLRNKSFSDILGSSSINEEDKNMKLNITYKENFYFDMMIEDAFKKLNQRELFIILRMLDGYTQTEIAKELGCTSEAVRQRKVKAFNILKDYLDI